MKVTFVFAYLYISIHIPTYLYIPMFLSKTGHIVTFFPLPLVAKKAQNPNQPDLNDYTPLHTALYNQCVFQFVLGSHLYIFYVVIYF